MNVCCSCNRISGFGVYLNKTRYIFLNSYQVVKTRIYIKLFGPNYLINRTIVYFFGLMGFVKKLLRYKWSYKQEKFGNLCFRGLCQVRILRGESTSCLFFVSAEKFELVILNPIRLRAVNKISLMWLFNIKK